MPDLTIEIYWICQSNIFWQIEVAGSNNQTYLVTFDATSHKNRDLVEYDYSCTCPAYQFSGNRGNYCKHIRKNKHLRCGWTQIMHGGEPVLAEDSRKICPLCGANTVLVQYGV